MAKKDANESSRKTCANKEVKHEFIQFKATLSWKDINVYGNNTLFCGCVKTSEKSNDHIIKNVSGEVEYGRILAIMGSSGAGKTTLLNALSGRKLKGFNVSGILAINGRVTDYSTIKTLSSFVQQEDIFLENLTVREHLYFQSLLRFNDKCNLKCLSDRVNELILQLDLITCAENYIGGVKRKGISGGERKRVAIASEILGNPSILFLDEPTSGLDSHIAEKVITLLRKLASTGETLICTIHQPSSSIFTQFDDLLLICGGRVAYMGSIADAQIFFASQGYTIPYAFNPADFYIRSLAIESNKDECIENNVTICDAYLTSPFVKKLNIDTTQMNLITGNYKARCWLQFFVLFYRYWKQNNRDETFIYIFIEEFTGALLFGVLFWGQPLNQTGVKNINSALFFIIVTLLYQTFDVEISIFFSRMDLVYRELDSTLYSVTAHFWAQTLSSLPYQTIAALIFSIVFYFVLGFNYSLIQFGNYLLTSMLMSQSIISFVYLISALCLNEIYTTKITNSLLGILFVLTGTLVDFSTLPKLLQWTKIASFTYLGNEAIVLNQWHRVENISCEVMRVSQKPLNLSFDRNASNIICMDTGAKVIASLNYNPDNFEINNTLLFFWLIFYRLIANIALCLRLKRL